MSCPAGQIRRVAYTRRDGSKVASACIKDVGKPGKTPASQRIRVTKDIDLGEFGYKDIIHLNADERHKALTKAIQHLESTKKITKREAAVKILRRINLLSILNKNTNVTVSDYMERDRNWISRTYLSN
jgi:hypothetical protein